jgi:hypothetical protein
MSAAQLWRGFTRCLRDRLREAARSILTILIRRCGCCDIAEVREKYNNKFRYILVDEYQDTTRFSFH